MLSFTVFAAAASAATMPADPQRTIEVDGLTVTYQVEQRANGESRLYGRDNYRRPFEFIVAANGRVRGHVGGNPVDFRTKSK